MRERFTYYGWKIHYQLLCVQFIFYSFITDTGKGERWHLAYMPFEYAKYKNMRENNKLLCWYVNRHFRFPWRQYVTCTVYIKSLWFTLNWRLNVIVRLILDICCYTICYTLNIMTRMTEHFQSIDFFIKFFSLNYFNFTYNLHTIHKWK